MDERTQHVLDELRHITTLRAADLASYCGDYLDHEALEFLNDNPASIQLLTLSGGDVLSASLHHEGSAWTYKGVIDEWTVELHCQHREIPDYPCGRASTGEDRELLLFPPLPRDRTAGMDREGRILSGYSATAISYARNLRAIAAEHGVAATVSVSAAIFSEAGSSTEERFLNVRPVNFCEGGA